MMSFNDFIRIYSLKYKATSNMKIQQILSSLSLSHVGLVSGDGPFESDVGTVNLHPCHVSHWALYFHE